VVDPHGRRRWAGAAVTDDRAMLQRWSRLAAGELAIAARPKRASRWTCIRRPKDRPIWKLEASLKCRSCRRGRYAPPVHMIRLAEKRQTMPYVWVIRTRSDKDARITAAVQFFLLSVFGLS
jgi:hypothetical protein